MNLLAIVTEVRRWALLALLIVLAVAIAVAASSWRRAGDAERSLRAEKARVELRAQGDVPVEPVPDARPALAAAMQQNEAFAAQVQKLQRDLAHARPQLVVHAETEPAVVTAPARPAEPAGTPTPDCVLAQGDRLKLKLELALLRGVDGVAGVAGAMEAWAFRDMAEPALLVRQPFAGKLTSAEELAPPAPRRPPRFSLGALAWIDPRHPDTIPATYALEGGIRIAWGLWANLELRFDGQAAAGLRWDW